MSKVNDLWSDQEYWAKQEDRRREEEKAKKERMKNGTKKEQALYRIEKAVPSIELNYLTVNDNIRFEMSGMLSLDSIEALAKEFNTRKIDIELGRDGSGGCPSCGDYGSPSYVTIKDWT